MTIRQIAPIAAAFALSALTACVTPLPANDIQRLTTCRGTDLRTIRKNLLLAGYEIKSGSDSDLVTDFKQVSGYGRDRSMQRITVVKVDESTFRFNLRTREVRVEKDTSNGMSVTSTNPGTQAGNTVRVDVSQPIETTNDADRNYYQEYAGSYETTRREVCGG